MKKLVVGPVPVNAMTDADLRDEWKEWQAFAYCGPNVEAPRRMLEVSCELIRRARKESK